MSGILTVDDIISSVKRRSMVPTSQQTFSNADFVALMNEEMGISLVPELMSVREDMFLTPKTVSLQADKPTYNIPERAIGSAVKDIFYKDASGGRNSLPRLNSDQAVSVFSDSGTPGGLYLEGDKIHLVPTPASSVGSLEIWYYRRPNELVLTSTSATKITSISTVNGTTTYTVDTDLTGSLSSGDDVDFISAKSPLQLHAMDVALTAITASTVAVATDDIDDEASNELPIVGDYICAAKKSNIPMIPQEFHPVLAQMVACRCMESLGDLEKLQAANAKLRDMMMAAKKLISNRIEASVESVYNKRSIGEYLR